MAENLLALAVKPLDVATSLIQARRIQQSEAETAKANFELRQNEMGSEFRGLAPFVNHPEFGQRWTESMDRMAQRGILDPQRHAQLRNSPSPLLLQQGLAMTDTPQMALHRADRGAADRAYQDFRDVNGVPSGGQASPRPPVAPTTSMLSAPPPANDPTMSVSPRQVAEVNAQPQTFNQRFAAATPQAPGASPVQTVPQPAAQQADPLSSPLAKRLLDLMANPRADPATRAAAQTRLQQIVPGGTFGVVGESPDGRKIYGFIDPKKQVVNEYSPRGGQSAPSSSLTGDAYLQTLDPGRAQQIKAIAEGRMAPPSGFALKSPQIQELVRQVAQYEPGFDLNIWTQRNVTTRDFASGKSAQNVTALNTVIGHLGDLTEKAKALNNYQLPAVNYVANATSQAVGDKRVSEYRLAAKAVADEMARVFRQVGMSDSEIRQWHSALSENMSPEQQKGVIKTAIGLLESRLNALADQRSRGFANSVEPRALLNDAARKKLKAIEEWASGGGQSGTTSGGIKWSIEK